jgi:hypothetical protein
MKVPADAPTLIAVLFVAAFAGLGISQACSSTNQQAKTVKAEADLCKARAQYKAFALLAGGRLDPAPGSARASLEAAEDAFCAGVGSDGGP